MAGGRYLRKPVPAKKPRRGLKIFLIIIAVLLSLLLLAGIVFGVWFAIDPMGPIKFLGSGILSHYMGYVNSVGDVELTEPSKAETTLPTPAETTEGTVNTDCTEPSDATEPSETTQPTEETWPEVVSPENLTTFMLVGQNYREGEEHYLSDTMIMCTVNRDTNTLTMTSLLRDLYVPLPAYAGHGPGQNRINVCYHLGTIWTESVKGGMEMLALCVEQNFGIPIDHTVEVDFEAFEKIIDILGGVEVDMTAAEAKYLNSPVHDYYGFKREFEEGVQTLTGLEALAYVRIRSIDSDFVRTDRQRAVMNALIQKCKTMSLWDLNKLAKEVLPMITTDMTSEEMQNYVWEFLPMLSDLNIVSQKVPLEKSQMNGDWSYAGREIEGVGNVLEPNLWSHRKYLQQILGYADAN